MLSGFKRRRGPWIAGGAAIAAAAVLAVAVPTAGADPVESEPVPASLVGEAGGLLPDDFGPWAGDPVEFAFDAEGDATDVTGTFDVLHERPNGDLVGDFSGEITCLMVGGEVAVATGVISQGQVQLPDEPVEDVTGQQVSFTVHDDGEHDRFFWQWEFLGAPINDCMGTAPVFQPDWGDFDVAGSR